MRLRDAMADRTGAANAMVRVMGALFRWGRDREYVDQDPCAGIEMFASIDYPPWPESLVADALTSDDASIAVPVALLYLTAQRIGGRLRAAMERRA